MRFQALVPVICSLVAFILSFLCLFAGNKPGFMEDYSLITINTSTIGQGYVDELLTSDSDNPLADIWNQISEPIADALDDGLESVTEALGLQDWYSAHLMNYCDGTYTPTSQPNATISSSDIHQNISNCSSAAALFSFNPRVALEQNLNKTRLNITLDELHWPSAIDDAVSTLRGAYEAVFVLYCLAIGLIFFSLLGSLVGILALGRYTALGNVVLAGLAFLAVGLASAVVTAVIEIGGNAINKYGNDVSIEAKKGSKFLALTWVATALMFVSMGTWVVFWVLGRRHSKRVSEKGYSS
ncbi:hypothetical protein EJ05DRAFT_445273 [Pseudovirgaria hyperparasitica]|uniref:Integral membrane protein-like protein n=1 Tax=Pseudovirgaria hyperparasitica TaxID=470096 RepID=A0A6A6VTV5_9PEZI|nr:uncharacterized protein EJ05DRAFT_445273 [Pseudovirgaria hyperparasitica]KAF2753226.1 hypothetical protein EJ05DRAFT_445273 [Pseudovirgaria hyperparasitica]